MPINFIDNFSTSTRTMLSSLHLTRQQLSSLEQRTNSSLENMNNLLCCPEQRSSVFTVIFAFQITSWGVTSSLCLSVCLHLCLSLSLSLSWSLTNRWRMLHGTPSTVLFMDKLIWLRTTWISGGETYESLIAAEKSLQIYQVCVAINF